MQPLVIASSLPSSFNDKVEAHPGVGRLIRLDGAPWQVPAEATVLLSFQSSWKAAPAAVPADWPGALDWVHVASAGLDTFPAWSMGVRLMTRGVGAQSPIIAEYILGAVMAHEKRLFDTRPTCPAEWKAHGMGSVAGKTLGVAGLGSIGQAAARLALANGMEVLAVRRRAGEAPNGVTFVADLGELAARSDHLALALPKTPQTVGCIDADVLGRARPGLHLINIARGDLICDDALLAAMDDGRVGAATLDVTLPEPLPEGHPFWTHPRIRLTPHVAGVSEVTNDRMVAVILDNIDRYRAGQPLVGPIDREAGY